MKRDGSKRTLVWVKRPLCRVRPAVLVSSSQPEQGGRRPFLGDACGARAGERNSERIIVGGDSEVTREQASPKSQGNLGDKQGAKCVSLSSGGPASVEGVMHPRPVPVRLGRPPVI